MRVTGNFISHGVIENCYIKQLGSKQYLYLSIKNNLGQSSHFPAVYLDNQSLDIINKQLCNYFYVNSLSDLKNKPIFCLQSNDYLLSIINPENFELFSLFGICYQKEPWLKDLLNKHPTIKNSDYSLENKIVLSFFKENINTINILDEGQKNIIKEVEKVILKGKLNTELSNEGISKRMKL